jgi:hypothetical protein
LKMAKNKTTETDSNVIDFINAVGSEIKRKDGFRILELMREITGLEPKMWGPSIIGFGSYHYKYDSGHEGDAPLIGFSPRSSALTLYLDPFPTKNDLLQKLGKHKVGKVCIYINKLADVDEDVLAEMIRESFKSTKSKYLAQ